MSKAHSPERVVAEPRDDSSSLLEALCFWTRIGDMPLASQAKLLRVLEERSVSRVGENLERPIDAALICATHHDLPRLIVEKEFSRRYVLPD